MERIAWLVVSCGVKYTTNVKNHKFFSCLDCEFGVKQQCLSRSRTGKGEMTAGVSALIVSKITFPTLDLLKIIFKVQN